MIKLIKIMLINEDYEVAMSNVERLILLAILNRIDIKEVNLKKIRDDMCMINDYEIDIIKTNKSKTSIEILSKKIKEVIDSILEIKEITKNEGAFVKGRYNTNCPNLTFQRFLRTRMNYYNNNNHRGINKFTI
mgnify:CR=1 FL=1